MAEPVRTGYEGKVDANLQREYPVDAFNREYLMMDSTATLARPHDARITETYWSSPSGVLVFAKSLHLIAAVWIATLAFLWIATDQADTTNMLVRTLIPVLAIETLAVSVEQWTKALGGSVHSRAHEWEHALAWAVVPIMFLIGTAFMGPA